tara:strand:- start:21932 stop:24304 length:2373 start_codon:yes stop_codon:yes gene_type:complete
MKFDVAKEKVYLYGKGEVYYETTELKADYIELNLQTNEVYARGVPDSNGVDQGTPVFKDKDQEIEANDIKYNFDSRKGLITEAVTQQGDGYIVGTLVKKQPDNVIYIKDGKLCPCEDREAKTFVKARKLKIIPDDKIVTGVANLKIGAIPTPLVLPFGIFPNKQGASSGVVLPEYGFSPDQGLFLRNGGYFWSVNDNLDFLLTGDIYSRGSWGVALGSNYKRRYKYTGNVDLRYTDLFTENEQTLAVTEERIYKIYWKHAQDLKANPYQSFSADVNIYKNNRLDINSSANDYLSNSFKSNLNYTRKFGNSPFRLTLNSSYQLNRDTTAQFVLPEATLNMDRIYPFKRKYKIGRDRWYEKIGLTYSTNFRNQLKGHQDSIFTNEGVKDMQNAMKHNFGLNTSYKVMKFLSWQPFVNYSEHWEFKKLNKSWEDIDTSSNMDTVRQFGIVRDTLQEFGRYGTWDAGMNVSTKVYGSFRYRSGPIKAIRHVMTPAIGFTYRPDYTNRNYVKEVRTASDSLVNTYSIYDGSLSPYGTAPIGKESGSISFSLRNNLEMKVKSKKDTVKGEKKIKLLDQLNFATNYDIFADSMNWSNMSVIANTNLFNFFRINYNGDMDFYVVEDHIINENETRIRVNKFELNENGRLGRFNNHRLGINFSLGNKKQQERKKEKLKKMKASPYTYQNIPWTMSFGYTFNYNRPISQDTVIITQSLQFTTVINLTENWRFEGMTNFDFEKNEFGYTRFSIFRDMNCWEARITVVPKGGQQNYNFSINLKPSMFKDLKVERKRNYYDFN